MIRFVWPLQVSTYIYQDGFLGVGVGVDLRKYVCHDRASSETHGLSPREARPTLALPNYNWDWSQVQKSQNNYLRRHDVPVFAK